MKSWLRKVVQIAERFGCAVEQTRKGHYRIRRKDGLWSVTTAGTPGDSNAEHLLRQKLTRATILGRGGR